MKKTGWAIIAGIAAALGASLCCAGPLILLSIGISGTWIANLTALESFRPYLIGLAMIFFSWAGWQLFKPELSGRGVCDPEDVCAIPKVQRNRKMLFLVSVVIALGLVFSPYWIILFV